MPRFNMLNRSIASNRLTKKRTSKWTKEREPPKEKDQPTAQIRLNLIRGGIATNWTGRKRKPWPTFSRFNAKPPGTSQATTQTKPCPYMTINLVRRVIATNRIKNWRKTWFAFSALNAKRPDQSQATTHTKPCPHMRFNLIGSAGMRNIIIHMLKSIIGGHHHA